MIRKIISLFIILDLIFSQIGFVYANPGMAADFLYEIAMDYYQMGNLKEALHEAKKILLIEPANKEAMMLIARIEKKEPERILQIAAPIIVETAKKPALRQPSKREKPAKDNRKQSIFATLALLAREGKADTQAQVPKATIAFPKALEQQKRPIIIEKIITQAEALLQEEDKEPRVIAMEKILPKPRIVPDEWMIKPEEMLTSKELEGYHLFNEAELFINGRQIEITPIIIKDSIIRLPLEKIAKALNFVVFSPSKETLSVINADGLPLEFKVGAKEVFLNKQKFAVFEEPILKYEGWTMLALEDLAKALGLDARRDDYKVTLDGQEAESGKFITFTNTKPKLEKKPEESKIITEEEPAPVLGRLTAVPSYLRPDIRLQVRNNINSAYNHLTDKSLQSDELTITGDIYDYRLYSNFKWKQPDTNHFINDGKYVGLFGKDLWLEFLNLSANLAHIRTQSENYEGAQITKFYRPFSTKVYAGQRDVTVNGPPAIGAVRYYGHIAGVEQKYSSDVIDLSQTVIGTEAEAETELKSGTTAFPRGNIVSLTDATLKLPYRMDLSGQFAFCDYRPDDNRDTSISDHDWRLQTRMNGEKLYWDLRYEFVGNEYASLGDPSIYQDYRGWDLFSRYQLTKAFSLSGSYSRSRDNVDSIVSEPINKNRNLSLGANFSLSGNTNLGFNWLKGQTRTEDPVSGASTSTTYDYLFSLSRSWTDLMLLLTYDHYEFDSGNDYFTDTGSVSLYKFIPRLRGSYLRARQQVRKACYDNTGASDSIDYSSDFGFRYYFLRNLSAFGNLALNNLRTEGDENRDPLSINCGMQWDINQNVGFGLDFSFAPYDLSNKDSRNSKAWSTLFRFFNRFEITSPAKWAKIKGRIFKDLNGNGKYDAREPVFPGVTVRVPDEFIAQTNQEGLYLLDQIIPGAKKIIIEMKDLPIELIAPDAGVANVSVEPNKTLKLDFPLVEAGSITGRVFIDANNNQVYDLGEEGLEGLGVYLSIQSRRVESDENGYFSFEFLSPGTYKVTLDASQLPIEYKLASAKEVKIKLSARQVASDTNFRIVHKPIATKQF